MVNVAVHQNHAEERRYVLGAAERDFARVSCSLRLVSIAAYGLGANPPTPALSTRPQSMSAAPSSRSPTTNAAGTGAGVRQSRSPAVPRRRPNTSTNVVVVVRAVPHTGTPRRGGGHYALRRRTIQMRKTCSWAARLRRRRLRAQGRGRGWTVCPRASRRSG
ncbi:hypothetical protein B0H14DRAFT_366784 [Mycena olivaceomarginata]|nr:hypothetical protein B0H14DRAFT_366784 [Mycena olivaceomarginata]